MNSGDQSHDPVVPKRIQTDEGNSEERIQQKVTM
jgi:hypothetical protein